MVVATFTWRLKGDLRRSCRCRAANESNRSNRERFARHCGRSYHFPIAVSKAKEAESNHVKYWEIIIENLRNAGWNCGCMRTTDGKGRPIWVVAAERSDAGPLLCMQIKSCLPFSNSNLRFAANRFDNTAGFSQKSVKDLNQAEGFLPLGSSPLPDLRSQNQHGGEIERETI